MLAQSLQQKAGIEGKLRVWTSGLSQNLEGDWYIGRQPTEKLSNLREKLITAMQIFLARMESGSALLNEVEASNDIVSDDVLNLFEIEQGNLKIFYDMLTRQKADFTIICNHYHDDRLMEAYNDTIGMAKALFDMLEKMRWLIDEHNIDCGPRYEGTPLRTEEEIYRFLGVSNENK